MTNTEIFELLVSSAKKQGYDIIDVKWVSSCFVSETGGGSIVNFKIKQCRGWLFGVWFIHGNDEAPDKRRFELFGQPENCINKFKPSYSYFSYTSNADLDTDEKLIQYNINDACEKVFSPIRYDNAMAWTLSYGNFYPKNRLEAKWRVCKYRLHQMYLNFMGDVDIGELEYGVVNYASRFGSPYPFKGLVLFFKYLFNKKAKPYWNKL